MVVMTGQGDFSWDKRQRAVYPRDTFFTLKARIVLSPPGKARFSRFTPKIARSPRPIIRPSLLYIPPDGFPTRNQRNVCAAARSVLQDTGRQWRTNAAQHVPFHAGASARRNNAAFHGMSRIGMMFLRPLLFSLPCLSIPGRLWQGQTVTHPVP